MIIFTLSTALAEENMVLVSVKNTTGDHHDEYVIEYKDIDNDDKDTEHGKDYQDYHDIDLARVSFISHII